MVVKCSPPTPGCAAVEIVNQKDGQLVENVFHVMFNGAVQPTTAQLQHLAASIENQWMLGPSLAAAGCVLQTVKARDLTPGTGGDVIVQPRVTAQPAGAVGGIELPNNVTFAIKITTAFGGKSGHGRTFWPGLSTNQVLGSQITQATATDLLNRLQAMRAAVEGSDPVKFGVLSKWQNKVCRPNGDFKQMLLFATTDLNLDSQRRRLVGRGK